MRTVMLPFCELNAEDMSVAAARMPTPGVVCDGFTDFVKDVLQHGKPDLIVMDFSWVKMLPYSRYSDLTHHNLEAVPHLIIYAGRDADLPKELNIIGRLPSEDTHAPFFDTSKRNRLMMAMDAFETFFKGRSNKTVTAKVFDPVLRVIKSQPAALRARMCPGLAVNAA